MRDFKKIRYGVEGDFGGGDDFIVSSKLIINYWQTVSAESSTSFALFAVERPGARAACRSSAVEPRGGMSMEGGRMTGIDAIRRRKNLCDMKLKYMNEKIIYKDDGL